MSNEMIERVASALHSQGLEDGCENMSFADSAKLAKAAIAVMREPTLFMTDSANGIVSTQECREVYQAMIDAALKED